MADRMVPAGFEDVEETLDIAACIGVRVGQGIAHPGLGGEVDDRLEAVPGEQGPDRGAVGHVQAAEGEPVRRREALPPRFLQRHVVIRVHVVDADHRAARVQQFARDMVADEPAAPVTSTGLIRKRRPRQARRLRVKHLVTPAA